jgi:hypothetical protein
VEEQNEWTVALLKIGELEPVRADAIHAALISHNRNRMGVRKRVVDINPVLGPVPRGTDASRDVARMVLVPALLRDVAAVRNQLARISSSDSDLERPMAVTLAPHAKLARQVWLGYIMAVLGYVPRGLVDNARSA